MNQDHFMDRGRRFTVFDGSRRWQTVLAVAQLKSCSGKPTECSTQVHANGGHCTLASEPTHHQQLHTLQRLTRGDNEIAQIVDMVKCRDLVS